jgi:transposase-like protein
VPVVRHQREFWERAFREVERGAKVGEVARRLGVRAGTLSWWCWKLRRLEPGRRRQSRAEFLPVVVAQQAVPMPVAAVEVEASGVRLHVEIGTDVEYVSALVAAIRRRC